MSVREFFDEQTRGDVASVVAEIERRSGAEVVVSVHVRSAPYREADWLAGALMAFVVLCLLLFLPQEFAVITMPLEVLVGFAAGAIISRSLVPVQRLLTLRTTRRRAVALAANAEMFASGITRTRDRTGILIYVSALEREAVVVIDDGAKALSGDPRFAAIEKELETSVAEMNATNFLEALRSLADPLAALVPRRSDDHNELGDDIR